MAGDLPVATSCVHCGPAEHFRTSKSGTILIWDEYFKYTQILCQRASVLGMSESVWGASVKHVLKKSSGQAGRLPGPDT